MIAVGLPRIVGGPSAVLEVLLPMREEPEVAVSFKGVVTITEAAIREVVMTGTNLATRTLYLLDVNLAIETAVAEFLFEEQTYVPHVRIGLPPEPDREPVPDVAPVFAHAWTDDEWRVTAAALESDTRSPLTAVLAARLRAAMVPPSDIGTGVGWPR